MSEGKIRSLGRAFTNWNSECEVLTRAELTGLPATSASLATYNQTI